MSHNHNNSNAIERDDIAIGQPPPAKKQRQQLFTEYSHFTQIIQKLSTVFDPELLICIKWSSMGLKCDTCEADKKLIGKWTQKYVEKFNYTKIKKHLMSPKHTSRLSAEHKQLHPLLRKINTVINKTTINTNIPSKYDQIINSIDLVHVIIKTASALSKAKPFGRWGEALVDTDLQSPWHVDKFINAMDVHQKALIKIINLPWPWMA